MGICAEVDEQDDQLAAVAGVDQTGSIGDRDADLSRETRARKYEPRVTLRDRDRDTGGNGGPSTRLEARTFGSDQIEPGVPRMGPARQLRPRPQAGDMQRSGDRCQPETVAAIRSAASSSRSSSTVRLMRTKPSPLGPKPVPGDMTTAASSIIFWVNDADVSPSGTGAQM